MNKKVYDSKWEWKGSKPQKFPPGKLTYTQRPTLQIYYDS